MAILIYQYKSCMSLSIKTKKLMQLVLVDMSVYIINGFSSFVPF